MLGWEKYKIFERTKERSLRCGKTPFICTRARRKNALTLVEAVKARSRKFFFFLTAGVSGNKGELLLFQKLGKLGVGGVARVGGL